MEDFIYKQRKIARIYFRGIFAIGFLFILFMLGQISYDLITSNGESDINGLLIGAGVGFVWLMTALYCVVPTKLVLTDRGMQVIWNSKKRKDYPWQDIILRKTGPQASVLILIRDSDWILQRWVLLDGTNKQYKELISRIMQFKELTNIDLFKFIDFLCKCSQKRFE